MNETGSTNVLVLFARFLNAKADLYPDQDDRLTGGLRTAAADAEIFAENPTLFQRVLEELP